MAKLYNNARMTVSGTPGTGVITLSLAVSGAQTFAQAGVSDGDVIAYGIKDSGTNKFEVGHGTYSSTGPTLTRTTVLDSSDSGAAISLTSNAIVYIAALADNYAPQAVDTVAAFQNTKFYPDNQAIYIRGYYTIGVGAMWVQRVNAQPSHAWKFRSADRFLANGTTNATNGGWWQGYSVDGTITPEQFGAVPDGTTDCITAFTNAIAYMATKNSVSPRTANLTWTEIWLPSNSYYCSNTITFGNGGAVMRGAMTIGLGTGPRIYFPTDVCGIHCTQLAGGVRLEGFCLQTTNGSGTGAHGIFCECRVYINNVSVGNFSNHAIYLLSGGGSNTDNSYISNVNIEQPGQDGIRLEGPDSQVCEVNNVWMQHVGGAAIYDAGYFPNHWSNITVQGNGILQYQTRTGEKGAIVKGSDNFYYQVRPGQETAASTTDPATTVNDNIWIRLPGGPAPLPETWTSGHSYRAAPVIFSASGSVFRFIYNEAGYSPQAIVDNGMSFGGRFGNGVNDCSINVNNGLFRCHSGFVVEQDTSMRYAGTASTLQIGQGGDPDNGYVRQINDIGTGLAILERIDRTHKDYVLGTNQSNELIRYTSALTTTKLGLVTNTVPNAVAFRSGVWLNGGALSDGDYKKLDVINAPPTTGENIAGSVGINRNAAINSPWAWVCTTSGVDAAQAWTALILAPINHAYQANSTAPSANNLNLTTGNITGGAVIVNLVLSATLSANATATLPAVTSLVSALGNFYYAQMTYELRVINASSGGFKWTMAAGSGWSTFGNMDVVTATWRTFRITTISPTSAQIADFGVAGPYS